MCESGLRSPRLGGNLRKESGSTLLPDSKLLVSHFRIKIDSGKRQGRARALAGLALS